MMSCQMEHISASLRKPFLSTMIHSHTFPVVDYYRLQFHLWKKDCDVDSILTWLCVELVIRTNRDGLKVVLLCKFFQNKVLATCWFINAKQAQVKKLKISRFCFNLHPNKLGVTISDDSAVRLRWAHLLYLNMIME